MPTKSFPVTSWKKKLYDTFSGYPGGLETGNRQKPDVPPPEAVIERAVKGMLPKNRLGCKMFKNCLFMPVLNIPMAHNNRKR